MKKTLILLFLPIITVFLSGSYSDYNEIINEQLEIAENSGIYDNIPENASEILKEIGFEKLEKTDISSISFSEILAVIRKSLISQIKEPIHAMASVIAAALICAVAGSFDGEFSKSKTVINIAAVISAASCILVPMKETIISAGKVIEECSGFMLSFIPIYSSAMAASGNISSAAGFRALMLGACAIITRIANEIIVPLIFIYFALCIAGSISETDISDVSKSVKNFAIWILTFAMTVFSGIMGLGTIIASSSDSNFSKTAKFLIGSTIPVVGGTVSDALSAVKGCLEMTGNILGIYAIIVIAVIFIPSLITLLSWKLCLSVSSGISSILGTKNLSGLLSAASGVLGIMLALVTITAVMFIFSVAIMLMTSGG